MLNVPRLFLGLSLWLATSTIACHAAAPAMAITYAEQAAQLLRETGIYSAGRGVVLRRDDLLATGEGMLQLDLDGSTVALGPGSRLMVGANGELVLLAGWLKMQCGAARNLVIRTSLLKIACGASAILHADQGSSELFAESGALPVDDTNAGKPARRVELASEQFAARSGKGLLRVLARPPAAFLQAMPPAFRDATVALPHVAPQAPRRVRAATYAEVAPWLAGHPALRQQVQKRFQPAPPRRTAAAPYSNN